jgi:hypothetical protein
MLTWKHIEMKNKQATESNEKNGSESPTTSRPAVAVKNIDVVEEEDSDPEGN